MSEQLPDLVSRIRVDTTDIDKAVRKGAAFGSAFGSIIGNIAGGAISGGIAKVTGYIGGAVDAYAELEDATAAAGVVFGKHSGDVVAFAQKAADSAGISASAATNAALTFGTMGKSAGLSGKDLSGFSTEMSQLAGDMASFRGTSPEQAIEAVGAALRGETEPIRQYGVLLDDASLRQEAVRQGLIKTTKEALTPQQKVLAAHSLILKQTSDAQGDFARTSDSTANVQKRLAAEAANTQAELGQKLAPAMTAVRRAMIDVVDFISDKLIPKLQEIWTAVEPYVTKLVAYVRDQLIPQLEEIWTRLQPLVGKLKDAVETLVRSLTMLDGHLGDVASAVGVLVAAYVAYQAAQTAMAVGTAIARFQQLAGAVGIVRAAQLQLNLAMTANPIGLVIAAVAALVAGFVIAYNRSETFRNIVNGAMHGVQVGVGNAVGFMIDAFHRVLNVWLTVADGIISGAATALGWIPGLGGKLKAANRAFDNMREGIDKTMDGLAASARGWGDDVAGGLAEGISASSYKAVAAAGAMANKVNTEARHGFLISSPSKVFAEIGRYVGEGFVQGLTSTEDDITSTLDGLLTKVSDNAKALGTKVADGIRDAVKGGRGQLVSLAKEADTTRQAFADILGVASSVDLTQLGKGEDGTQTAASITAGLKGDVDQAAQFAADIAALSALHLNDQAIADLSRRGYEAAGATARALVEGGKATVTEVNGLEAQLQASGVAVAKVGSAAFYDAGVETAKGLARGFRSQQDVIDDAMLKIAKRMERQIRKALGIASPSRLFAAIGAQIPAGMAQGILANSGAVDAALRTMTPSGLPGTVGAQVGAGGSRTWAPTLQVYGSTDPVATAQVAMDELTWQARLEGANV